MPFSKKDQSLYPSQPQTDKKEFFFAETRGMKGGVAINEQMPAFWSGQGEP
jgi:hypothetical protein